MSKPTLKKSRSSDLEYVLKRLAPTVQFNDDGSMSSKDFSFELPFLKEAAILQNLIVWTDTISDALKETAIREAVRHTLKSNDLSSANFIAELIKQVRNAKRIFEDYYFCTNLNASNASLTPINFTMAGEFTKITGNPADWVGKMRSAGSEQAKGFDLRKQCGENYASIYGKVKATSPSHAVEETSKRLDFICGIMNFIYSYSRTTTYLGYPRPNAQLMWGNFAFVSPDKKELTKSYLYAEFDITYHTHVFNQDRVSRIEKFFRHVKKHSDNKKLEGYFAAYYEAIAEFGDSRALQRLWSLAEKITGSSDGNFSKTIARRLSFIAKDRKYRALQIEAAGNVRHSIVHMNKEHHFVDTHVKTMRAAIDGYLMFIVQNPNLTLAEIREISDLPRDLNELRRKIEKLNFAEKLLASW